MSRKAEIENLKNQVRDKLAEVFMERPEDLSTILFFLDKENKNYEDNACQPYAPQWKFLKDTIESDEDFKLMAEQVLDELARQEWQDKVRKKLGEIFAESRDNWCRILFFLDEEDEKYKDNASRPYASEWNSLRAIINSDRAFRSLAKRLADETKRGERDQRFRAYMNQFYNNMSHSDANTGPNQSDSDANTGPNQSDSDANTGRNQSDSDADTGRNQSDSDADTGRNQSDSDANTGPNQSDSDANTGPNQSDSDADTGPNQKFDESRHHKISPSVAFSLARVFWTLSHESQRSVLEFAKSIVTNPRLSTGIDDVVGLMFKGGGSVVMVGLAAVHLSYTALTNIRRWWCGDISGKRCIKNLLDTSCSVAAGVGGGCAGAALGTMCGGPVGTVVGGIVGGLVSAAGVKILSDKLTQKLFGLPKEEALENAYRHLSVKMTVTNAEVNTAFHRLCLKTHPDKPGGNTDDFIILQSNMAVIRLARGYK